MSTEYCLVLTDITMHHRLSHIIVLSITLYRSILVIKKFSMARHPRLQRLMVPYVSVHFKASKQQPDVVLSQLTFFSSCVKLVYCVLIVLIIFLF